VARSTQNHRQVWVVFWITFDGPIFRSIWLHACIIHPPADVKLTWSQRILTPKPQKQPSKTKKKAVNPPRPKSRIGTATQRPEGY
jgi:hypothetical protein